MCYFFPAAKIELCDLYELNSEIHFSWRILGKICTASSMVGLLNLFIGT